MRGIRGEPGRGPWSQAQFLQHSWALGTLSQPSLALAPLSPRAFSASAAAGLIIGVHVRVSSGVNLGLVLGRPGLINGVPRSPGDEPGKQGIRAKKDAVSE